MSALQLVLAAPRAADGTEELSRPRPPAPPPRAPGPGATAVVIDVLRATTTLTEALANGASRVIPAGTVGEAFEWKRRHPDALLCGERDGRIVPGFDLGNSPFEYPRERVAGRTLIFASTNGSQALRLAAPARTRVIASFVNARVVVERVQGAAEIWLIAAGKLGAPALEDLACAGWIVRALAARGFAAESREVRLALAVAPADGAGVRALVEGAQQGRHLRSLGGLYARDVEFCASLDARDAVFEL